MDENTIDFSDVAQSMRRELEHEREKMVEKMEQLDGYLQLLNSMDKLISDHRKLQGENELLREQLVEEKKQRADMEMKVAEMSKLTAGVASKASEEAVLKALSTYVKRSKRKTADKRAFAKTATLEIANANGLSLPEDLAIMIDFLDDEQVEAKVVNVTGNYNDVHDNKGVKMN